MSLAGKNLAPGTKSETANVTFSGAVIISEQGGSLNVHGAGGLTAVALNGGGALPTITGVTHCVASVPKGHDMGGNFLLTVDSSGVAAGTIATVAFGTALPAAPVAVFATATNTTGSVASVTTVEATALATTGFTVSNSGSVAPTQTVNVQYFVVAA
jgi:hypothetical protein